MHFYMPVPKKKTKRRKDFKFHTFNGCFSSDIVAVKGLIRYSILSDKECTDGQEFMAGWLMSCIINPVARVQLLHKTGWRIFILFFQFFRVNTCVASSIPVSPSRAQDTHRSMHTLKISRRMWHENAKGITTLNALRREIHLERGSAGWSCLKGWEKVIFNQTHIWTVSKAVF